MELNGLTNINIELTDFCNKNCWMCGRRQKEKINPEIFKTYGFIDFELLKTIAVQLPNNIVVQLHNNGEALLYPQFGDAVRLFHKQITNIVSNGKLLVEKSNEIINNLDTIAISVFEKDPEADEQFEIIKEFLDLKKNKKPYTILRMNGEIDSKRYEELNLPLARRVLHAPGGSYKYTHPPTIPESGICRDFMNHLAINKNGDVSICVRYDPERKGVLGNIKENTLEELWNGEKRMNWMQKHKSGDRKSVPLCSTCEYWGVPTGA